MLKDATAYTAFSQWIAYYDGIFLKKRVPGIHNCNQSVPPPQPILTRILETYLVQLLLGNELTDISVWHPSSIELVSPYRHKGYRYPFLTPVAGNGKRNLFFLLNTARNLFWEVSVRPVATQHRF